MVLRQLSPLVLGVTLTLVAGCGDDSDPAVATVTTPESTTTSTTELTTTSQPTTTAVSTTTAVTSSTVITTTSTTAAPPTTTAPLVMLRQVIDSIERDLSVKFPESPSDTIGCGDPDTTTVARGSVYYCDTERPPGFEEGNWLIVVVDHDGTAAYTAGTDIVDLHDLSGPGLFCRDLLALPYLGDSRNDLSYLFLLAYWFQDGEPDRMDADRNGVPCETLFEPDVVTAVWSGGLVQ